VNPHTSSRIMRANAEKLHVAHVSRDAPDAAIAGVVDNLEAPPKGVGGSCTRCPEVHVTTLDDLTTRQRALLDALRRLHRTRGYAPSIRELGGAVGLASTSSVYHHVRILEERGLVERRKGAHRTLRVRDRTDQVRVS
jgi:repressor LexA